MYVRYEEGKVGASLVRNIGTTWSNWWNILTGIRINSGRFGIPSVELNEV